MRCRFLGDEMEEQDVDEKGGEQRELGEDMVRLRDGEIGNDKWGAESRRQPGFLG